MMTDQTAVYGMVRQIFVELFEIDESLVTMDANLYEDLDIDSIDAVDLIVRLKDEINLKMSPEQYKQIRTVGDVVNTVTAKLAGGA